GRGRARTSPARRRTAGRRCSCAVRVARGRSSASRGRIPGRSAHRSPWWIDSLGYEGLRERWAWGWKGGWSSGGCAPVLPGREVGAGCGRGRPGGGGRLLLGLGEADAPLEGRHQLGVVAGDELGVLAGFRSVAQLRCDVLLGAAARQL